MFSFAQPSVLFAFKIVVAKNVHNSKRKAWDNDAINDLA